MPAGRSCCDAAPAIPAILIVRKISSFRRHALAQRDLAAAFS
ncbi:MAG TPA: hypothetical protein VHR45_20985 [Thermoanaerobaculia bacterium]|nr:hypothetical protein [Thermoanaerobaculia bacterium]